MPRGTPKRDSSGRYRKGAIPSNKIVLPEEELEELYSRIGSKLIARLLNISKPTALRNLHEYKIKMRKQGAPKILPSYWRNSLRKPKSMPAWNKEQTKETNLSIREISDKLKGSNNIQWKPEIHTGEMVKYACGCGELIPKFDKKGRRRYYKQNHCPKGLFEEGSVPWNKGKAWDSATLKKIFAWRRPNNEETFLIDFFARHKLPFKYVGDGAIIIENRNPDFINCNGRKKIIEFFGEYWHTPKDEEVKREIYSRYGYDMLVIWGKDLKNEKQLLAKIQRFNNSNNKEVSNAR